VTVSTPCLPPLMARLWPDRRPEGKGPIADVGRIVAAAARAMLQGEGRYAPHCQERSCCNTRMSRDYARHETRACYSASPHPRATEPLRGTEGQRMRESEDTGDTCTRSLSPKITLLFAGQTLSGDTGDSGDTFWLVQAVPFVDDARTLAGPEGCRSTARTSDEGWPTWAYALWPVIHCSSSLVSLRW
jgi:hypothetical protein